MAVASAELSIQATTSITTMASGGGAAGREGRTKEDEVERLPMPSRNPLPLSASQEAQVREVFNARVRSLCADDIKGVFCISPFPCVCVTWGLDLYLDLVELYLGLVVCPTCSCLSVYLSISPLLLFGFTSPRQRKDSKLTTSPSFPCEKQPSQNAPATAPSASRSRAAPSRTP